MLDAIIFGVIALFVLAVVAISTGARDARNAAAKREEARQLDEKYEENRLSLRQEKLGDWAIVADAKVEKEAGFVAMDSDGKSLRLISCKRDAAELEVTSDETVPISSLTSLSINQPQESRTVTHKEFAPVAVGSGRSPGRRAVVGAALAGPTGAMIGGMSGLGGKHKIEEVPVERHETVYYKGHPKLIIGVDDVIRPRRVLEFSTVKETNEWSSRIHAAMNRSKR